MKAQVADYQTRVYCLRIAPKNGTPILIAQYPTDLKMSNGTIYQSTVGYEFTGYQATDSMSPSVVDLEGIAGFAGIDKDSIASGYFDNARCYLFATSWTNPVEDYEPVVCTILGKTTLEDDKFKIEEMALIDVLNQSVGKTYTPTCQKRFGGQEYAGCKKVPTVVTTTVQAVTNHFTIKADGLTNPHDFFGEGSIRFLSGNNFGTKALEIKTHTAAGVITTHEPFYYLPEVGNQIEITEGCRKRKEDCKSKNNILNFGGFPTVPTQSQYVDRQVHNAD